MLGVSPNNFSAFSTVELQNSYEKVTQKIPVSVIYAIVEGNNLIRKNSTYVQNTLIFNLCKIQLDYLMA